MQSYRENFLSCCQQYGVLRFGQFTLKSGRVSPYFFNAGLFNTGAAMDQVGSFYARAAIESGIEFDMLFGPAYKGIPLVAVTAAALAREHGRDVPLCFNRKEAKDHGEGGNLVGAPLAGRVLIVDDVITAGTAITESFDIISSAGASAAGVLIALDRQERGKAEHSAVQEVEQKFNLRVASIARLSHLIDWLATQADRADELEQVSRYRERYAAKTRD